MSTDTASLYHRLGRHEGISRIVDDVMAAHLSNPLVRTRYENSQDIERVGKMAVEFFCAGTGGPEPYTGRDLVATHKGMNINEQEYLSVMDDIVGALEKNGIDQQSRNEVVAILYSLKGQVLRL
jgi:hemoglobin